MKILKVIISFIAFLGLLANLGYAAIGTAVKFNINEVGLSKITAGGINKCCK